MLGSAPHILPVRYQELGLTVRGHEDFCPRGNRSGSVLQEEDADGQQFSESLELLGVSLGNLA